MCHGLNNACVCIIPPSSLQVRVLYEEIATPFILEHPQLQLPTGVFTQTSSLALVSAYGQPM